MPYVQLVAQYGIPLGIALYAVWTAFTHPEKLDYLWGWIAGKLSLAGTRVHRNALGRRMDSHLNDFAASAMMNLDHIEPTGVRMEWVEGQSDVRASLAQDGDLVIYLRPELPDAENLARAALAFVGKQFIPRAKLSLTPRQRQSMDLYVTGRLLDEQGSLAANEFYSTVLQPLLQDDPRLSDLVEACSEIDRKGYFYPVLIQQLVFMTEKVAVGVPKEKVWEEVSAFIDWLRARSVRFDKDDTVPLFFRGGLISCGIVLVAKWEKAAAGDHTIFANAGVRYARDGFETVYVAGDIEYRDLIERAANDIETRTDMIATVDTVFNAQHRLASGRWVTDRTRLILLRSAKVQRYVANPGSAITEADLNG